MVSSVEDTASSELELDLGRSPLELPRCSGPTKGNRMNMYLSEAAFVEPAPELISTSLLSGRVTIFLACLQGALQEKRTHLGWVLNRLGSESIWGQNIRTHEEDLREVNNGSE